MISSLSRNRFANFPLVGPANSRKDYEVSRDGRSALKTIAIARSCREGVEWFRSVRYRNKNADNVTRNIHGDREK